MVIRETHKVALAGAGLFVMSTLASSARAATYTDVALDAEAAESGSTFIVNESGLRIDVTRSSGSTNSNTRALLEFDISAIPDQAPVESVTLTLDIGLFESQEQGGQIINSSSIDFYGYSGDGVLTSGDADNISNFVGTTGEIQNGGTLTLSIDPAFVESLLDQADFLGLVGRGGADGLKTGFFSSEFSFSDPPPTLSVQVAPTPLASAMGITLLGGMALGHTRRRRRSAPA